MRLRDRRRTRWRWRDLQRPAAEVTAAARKLDRGAAAPLVSVGRTTTIRICLTTAPASYAAAAPGRPYDAEIAFVDAEIGALLGRLDRSRTIVVVTADHGEALGEHGEPDHGFFLYDATLQRSADHRRSRHHAPRRHEQVRSIDIAPTIARARGCGLANARPQRRRRKPAPSCSRADRDRRSRLNRRELVSAAAFRLERAAVGPRRRMEVRRRAETGALRPSRRSRGDEEPRCSSRRQVGRPAGSGRCSRDHDHFRTEPTATPPTQPDAATVARLQALGYVGAFAPSTAPRRARIPRTTSPTTGSIATLFNRALGLLGSGTAGRSGDGAAADREDRTSAHSKRTSISGNAYSAQGRMDAALGEYDAAAQLNPDARPRRTSRRPRSCVRGDSTPRPSRGRGGACNRSRLLLRSLHARRRLPARAAAGARRSTAFGRAVELNGRRSARARTLRVAAMRLDSLDVAARSSKQMIALGLSGRAGAFQPRRHRRQRRGNKAEARAPLQAGAAGGPDVQAGPGRAGEDKIA